MGNRSVHSGNRANTNKEWCWRVTQRYKPDGGPHWHVALRAEIEALARTLREPVILDAGCGLRNMLSVDFKESASFRVGIDIDREACGNTYLDSFLQSDLTRIPLRSNSVDVLLSGYVLEHLADPVAALREFYRVLKPGGTAFIWTPNLLNYAIQVSALTPTAFHNWINHLAFPENARDNCSTYYRANTPGALVRAVHDAGLSPHGALRFGAGSFLYWRFSRPLFLAAVLGSHLVARSPLRRLMNVLLVRCAKPSRANGR